MITAQLARQIHEYSNIRTVACLQHITQMILNSSYAGEKEVEVEIDVDISLQVRALIQHMGFRTRVKTSTSTWIINWA